MQNILTKKTCLSNSGVLVGIYLWFLFFAESSFERKGKRWASRTTCLYRMEGERNGEGGVCLHKLPLAVTPSHPQRVIPLVFSLGGPVRAQWAVQLYNSSRSDPTPIYEDDFLCVSLKFVHCFWMSPQCQTVFFNWFSCIACYLTSSVVLKGKRLLAWQSVPSGPETVFSLLHRYTAGLPLACSPRRTLTGRSPSAAVCQTVRVLANRIRALLSVT